MNPYNDKLTCYLCETIIEDEENDVLEYIIKTPNNLEHFIGLCKSCYDYNISLDKEKDKQSFLVCRSSLDKEEKCDVCNVSNISKMNLYNILIYDYRHMVYLKDTQDILNKKIIKLSEYNNKKEIEYDIAQYTYLDTQEIMICDKCQDYCNKLNKSKVIVSVDNMLDKKNLINVLKREKELYNLNKKRKEKAYEVIENCLNKDIAEYILQNNHIDIKG